MKKIAAIILTIAVMAQAALAAEFNGTYAEAKAQSARLGKPLLLDFFADW